MTVLIQEAPPLSPQREVSELRCETFQLRNLWNAVIEQAALDLRGPVGHRSKAEREDAAANQADAARWVRGEPRFPYDSTDYFAEVCDLADVDSTLMREKLLQGGKQAPCAPCTAREAGRVTAQTLASAVRTGIAYLESDPDARTGEPKKPYMPGDLLRMTCIAANVPLNQAEAQRRWPWLGEDVDPPCACEKLIVSNALLVLQHLYETHVRARQDWAAEEFVAWVQKHEHLALAPEQPEQPQDAAQVSDIPVPECAAAIYASGKAGAMEQDHAGASQ